MVRVVRPVDDYKGLLAKRALEKIRDVSGDIEHDHQVADEVLCELLEGLGFKEVVEEYRKIEKWYS